MAGKRGGPHLAQSLESRLAAGTDGAGKEKGNTMISSAQEKGFTIIELMAVLAVIGILSAVSIMQFVEYQSRGFDARAEHDLRLAVTAEEAYFSENEVYAQCQDAQCESELQSFTLSQGTKLEVTVNEEGDGIVAEAYHPRGEKKYRFESDTGFTAL